MLSNLVVSRFDHLVKHLEEMFSTLIHMNTCYVCMDVCVYSHAWALVRVFRSFSMLAFPLSAVWQPGLNPPRSWTSWLGWSSDKIIIRQDFKCFDEALQRGASAWCYFINHNKGYSWTCIVRYPILLSLLLVF